MNILEQVCVSKKTPLFTPHGYVISDDGIIHSLTKRWCHGVIIALLFPKLAEKNGYEAPDEDYDVFKYQRFELDHSRETSVIRISSCPISGELNISKGEQKASELQIEALLLIFKEQGLSLNDMVQSDLSQLTIRTLIKNLRSGEI